ncbi:M3 family metallopeptidase [Microcella sp.]|uniref:M3 family metallopeptidase n=1 Tax=Microcella sp. TaxID=1913979 RepID=UPI002569BD8F|nr:M3 family metallopeptidase [Microcella sp.]MBX9470669.1 M3 family metallopeptidase [Microcella sp.]
MSNPFLVPSTLPYQLPPFAEITDDHYAPAIEQGMAEQLAEIQNITRRRDMPSFENTMVPLESSGQLLMRVLRVFYNKASADSNDATNALEEELAPKLAAHEDAIKLDSALYWRIAQLHGRLDELALTPEQRYLVERHYTEMTLAGAGLDDEQKTRLSELNARLSTLTTKFEKNLLADTNELAVVIDDAADLDGLSPGEISAAAQAAADRGLEGKCLITLVLPTGHPWLESLTNREVRDRIMAASRARGSRGGEHDNREVLLEIVQLRAERAALLGFDNHAAFVTADQTAKTPARVAEMLDRLAPAAARNAAAEQQKLAALAGHSIEAQDWAFYNEKVRKADYDVDTSELRPYFEAERVLQQGVFAAATKVYGITFTERTDLVGYHPEVRVFEVRNEDGSDLGLYLLDLYTRDSKRGGAWMNELIGQNTLLEHPTIVVNNLNVPKPAAGEPTLLTFDEVNTFFHEFGHALHGLFAHVTYPRFTGTNVYRDFVEFPSQVNEMWMLWPEIVNDYAVHHVTGEPIPAETLDRVRAAQLWGEGFATSEYLAAALLDQAWHTLSAAEAAAVTDVAAFEAAALTRVGLDNPAVPTRYSSTYFAHTFSGGYDAGYYSYIWSEVLDADTVQWFEENGGLTRANGDRFRHYVLGLGGAGDPLDAYREFRGRDAVIEPLLARRGLVA